MTSQWQHPFNDTEEFIKMSKRGYTCWKTEIEKLFKYNGDVWENVEANTMSYAVMIEEFDAGFGGVEGCEFTLWTKKYVYFPVCYDGSESVAYVSRYPDGKPTRHIGG